MLKRIAYSLLFCMIFFLLTVICFKVTRVHNGIDYSVIGAITGFVGMFTGYGIGKKASKED